METIEKERNPKRRKLESCLLLENIHQWWDCLTVMLETKDLKNLRLACKTLKSEVSKSFDFVTLVISYDWEDGISLSEGAFMMRQSSYIYKREVVIKKTTPCANFILKPIGDSNYIPFDQRCLSTMWCHASVCNNLDQRGVNVHRLCALKPRCSYTFILHHRHKNEGLTSVIINDGSVHYHDIDWILNVVSEKDKVYEFGTLVQIDQVNPKFKWIFTLRDNMMEPETIDYSFNSLRIEFPKDWSCDV